MRRYILILSIAILTLSSCIRRELDYDNDFQSAVIPVKIDWSQTGFSNLGKGGDYVHRVSIRFFPKDGSPAFDRYLEIDVNEGEITVPIGSYSVVIFNESVYDAYFQDAFSFSNIDDYNLFSVSIVEDDKSQYGYFSFSPNEKVIVEPKRLASWSLDNFEVTEGMITHTRSNAVTEATNKAEEDMINALTKVMMRPLTYNTKVLANVTFLSSAQKITGITKGFASKVYMASGKTENLPSSYVFILNGRKWADDTKTDGTTEMTFLTFGMLPSDVSDAKYLLDLDVLFTIGERHQPLEPLHYDVTNQVGVISGLNIYINVSLTLPKVEGGVHVGDWDDEIHEIK